MTSTWQLLRTAALTCAWLLILPCLILLISAIVPVIPWVRIYAVDVVPNRAPWFLLFSLAALTAGLIAQARRATLATRGLIATASVTALVASGVLAHFLYIAHSNGARINLVDTLSTRQFSENAVPDESRVYSAPGGEPLWLDIYRPRQTLPRRSSPVIMFVHGGGFVEGSRKKGAANLRRYADAGWTVISIDYRLARPDRPTWDLATRDVRCAMAWTAAHADELGIDISRLTLSGASAGGSLAIAAAYSADSGVQDASCGPRVPHAAAVVAKAPLIDALGSWQHAGELRDLQRSCMSNYLGGPPERYPERYAAVDVRRYIGPTNPPTLLLAGANDPLLPAAAIEDFARRLAATGDEARLVMFPYSGHDFNTTFDSVTNQTVVQTIAGFLTKNDVGPASIVAGPRQTTPSRT
jgi:acetyl esterase/lipase